MRLRIDRSVWDSPKKFARWHKSFMANRTPLAKLPRLKVDVTDERAFYSDVSRLGDFVSQRYVDASQFAMAKSPAQQAIVNQYVLALAYCQKEMLVSDSDAYERISRILNELKKIKPCDGEPALYRAFSLALLKV